MSPRHSPRAKTPALAPPHERRLVAVAATRLRHALQAAIALRQQLLETADAFPHIPRAPALRDAAGEIAPLLTDALEILRQSGRRPPGGC